MLTRFMCWMVGHKVWVQAFTDIPTGKTNPFTNEPGFFYNYTKLPFCQRCGHEPEVEVADG